MIHEVLKSCCRGNTNHHVYYATTSFKSHLYAPCLYVVVVVVGVQATGESYTNIIKTHTLLAASAKSNSIVQREQHTKSSSPFISLALASLSLLVMRIRQTNTQQVFYRQQNKPKQLVYKAKWRYNPLISSPGTLFAL